MVRRVSIRGRPVLLAAAAVVLMGAIGAAVAALGLLARPGQAPLAPTEPPRIRVSGFVQDFTYAVPPGQTARLELTSQAPAYTVHHELGQLQLFSIWAGGEVTDPVEVVEGLRETMAECVAPPRATMLGNLPAVGTDFRPTAGACGRLSFHQPGIGIGDITASTPSILVVAQTSHGTIGVLISAATDQDLAQWRRIARQYVDRFVFTSGANRMTP